MSTCMCWETTFSTTSSCRESPGVPRHAVRIVRPRLVRVPRTYSTRGPGGKPPCASGTYSTREAGTRSPYVPYGGAGACVSAQREASIVLIVLRPPCKGSAERKWLS